MILASANQFRGSPMSDYVIPAPPVTAVPVAGGGQFPVRRVFCVGRNYADHALEMGGDPTREPPFFFSKPSDAVTLATQLPTDPISKKFEHEAELVVAIGKGGSNIPANKALEHVYGYSVGCDLTRRDMQGEAKKAGRPWDMSKGFDNSAPIGEIKPASAIGHPSKGRLTLSVNGTVKQDGDISQMTWPVPDIVAFLSTLVALAPGDLIYTGTPAGVGPLVEGDKVEITCEGVATCTFTLV
jgi:fumarylpyruvate hydrolase